MFQNKEYIQYLEDIREKELLTKKDLAILMNISYTGLMRILSGKTINFKTKRIIKEFIENMWAIQQQRKKNER